MKIRFASALAILLVAVAVSPSRADVVVGQPASASGSGDPTFDENGNVLADPFGLFAGPGVMAADPSNGGAPALTFFINFGLGLGPVGRGDVLVFDVDGSLSDMIRFTDAAGSIAAGQLADRMIFYSADIGGGFLADTGLPANAGTGATGGPVVEVAGIFTYGFGEPFQYTGLSPEEVPEPSRIMGLVGLTAMGLVGLGWRRRRTTA